MILRVLKNLVMMIIRIIRSTVTGINLMCKWAALSFCTQNEFKIKIGTEELFDINDTDQNIPWTKVNVN